MDEKDTRLAELMRLGRAGDSQAYSTVLTEIAGAIRGRVRRKLGAESGEAEDVVQEALLAIHLRSASWDARLPLMPWVLAIADHKVVDALRRRYRRDRVVSRDLSADDLADIAPAHAADPDRSTVDVDRHIERLPGKQQAVLRGLTRQGGTVATVAGALGMSPGAVRVALHRALKALAAASGEPPAQAGRSRREDRR